MLRGTRVGQAYVALSVDGDGVNEDIADAFDDVDFDKIGDEHGKKYAKALEGHLKGLDTTFGEMTDKMGKNFTSRLSRAIENDSAISDSVSKTLAKAFDEGKLDDLVQHVGRQAGVTFGGEFDREVKRSVLDSIESAMLKAARSGALDLNSLVTSANSGSGQVDLLGSTVDDAVRRTRAAHKKMEDDLVRSLAEREKIEEASAKRVVQTDAAMWKIRNASAKAYIKYLADIEKGRTDDKGVSVSRNKDSSFDVGKLLGAGSRNNALNLFGKSIGGITKLITGATGFAAKMGSTFVKGFSEAADGASVFQKTMSGVGSVITSGGASLATLGASLPALAVGFVAVAAAATILVSVLSAALALVAALAATVASSLVGALAVGAGAFAALGVAAGLATLAFTAMTDQQKKDAAATFEPIHEMAAGLGQIMLRDIIPAFEEWSKNLQNALVLIKPLADVMGGAFARAGTILTKSLSGPGIQLFIDALGNTLPRIVKNLSSAFGDFLNGVSGVFAAIMPFVLRFSEYLRRVADDFAKWATSTKGQNAIKDFVDRALESLESLWGFVKRVGGLISDVLFNEDGQKTGNDVFARMGKAAERLATYLGKEDRLENWFKDGKKFADALGDSIELVAGILEDLNQSGVIDVIADLASFANDADEGFKTLPGAITSTIAALTPMIGPLNTILDLINKIKNPGGGGLPSFVNDTLRDAQAAANGQQTGSEGLETALIPPNVVDPSGRLVIDPAKFSRKDVADDLIKSGHDALAQTSESNGGHMADPVSGNKGGDGPSKADEEKKKKKWKNKWKDWALSLIADSEKLADTILASFKEGRQAIWDAMEEARLGMAELFTETNNNFAAGIADAAKSTDAEGIKSAFASIITSASEAAAAGIAGAKGDANALIADAVATGNQLVSSAQSALDTAARRLAGATSPKEAKAALAEVKKAQADLALAKAKSNTLIQEANVAAAKMIDNAKASQAMITGAQNILAEQGVLNLDRVNNLTSGVFDTNATLADYAEARRQIAEKLQDATQKLAEAIDLRDGYSKQVADSIRSFGALMTAQAKTIEGVQQALTAGDITDNLRDRLNKIKKFQENLRLLLAQGLSQSAYKQLVDAGVESGSAFAEALVAGGQGSISEVNSLTDQIDGVATGLGESAASILYQAGVDAAQGLVDGLTSLSTDLDSAATALGESIAAAIKKSLGIASPSKVMYGLMFDDVGDGTVNGLDAAGSKVSAAASRLADRVAVSPEVAQYAARQGTSATEPVSGNSDDPRFRDLSVTIVTPTEDPHAVATEAINEITGRL